MPVYFVASRVHRVHPGRLEFRKADGTGSHFSGHGCGQDPGGDAARALRGSPGDFQLVESEGERQTQLQLRVSPRVGVLSAKAVKEFFLQRVQQGYGGTLADRLWRHSAAFEIVIDEPFVTRTGKILTLHLRSSHTAKTTSS
jgi:hypothetical protein